MNTKLKIVQGDVSIIAGRPAHHIVGDRHRFEFGAAGGISVEAEMRLLENPLFSATTTKVSFYDTLGNVVSVTLLPDDARALAQAIIRAANDNGGSSK